MLSLRCLLRNKVLTVLQAHAISKLGLVNETSLRWLLAERARHCSPTHCTRSVCNLRHVNVLLPSIRHLTRWDAILSHNNLSFEWAFTSQRYVVLSRIIFNRRWHTSGVRLLFRRHVYEVPLVWWSFPLDSKSVLPLIFICIQSSLISFVARWESCAFAATLAEYGDVVCHLIVLGPKSLSRHLCNRVVLVLVKGDPLQCGVK